MFAGIDSLIGLLIFVAISIVASWLQKRQRGGQDQETPAPARHHPHHADRAEPPPIQHPSQKPASWEEELKRLLEGQLPETEPAPPPLPPVIVQTPRQAPSPIHDAPTPPPEHAHKSVFDVLEQRNPVDVDMDPGFHSLPGLTESDQAYQQASQLDRKVEQHLQEVTRHPVGATHVRHKAVTSEASVALALLRDPKSARSGMLLSVILGPPRALADF